MGPLIGHRGVASLAPENTLAGIHKAAELGLQWLEMDVTLLGDGTPVMLHDARLDRTTNRTGYAHSLRLSEAKQLDCGSWFATDYANEPLATLADALALIKAWQLGLNLELKVHQYARKHLVMAVQAALSHVDFPDAQLIVSSFCYHALALYRATSSSQIGCLYKSLPRNWQHLAAAVGAVSIHLDQRSVTQPIVDNIKKAGFALYCYTVNDVHRGQQLLDWGVSGLITDRPQDYLPAMR